MPKVGQALSPGLGLRARFSLWLALFVPAMMLAAYAFFSRHQRQTLSAEILLRARTICSGLASAAEEALVMKDDLALAKLTADVKARNPGVVFCSVSDADGRIWAHTDLSLVNTVEAFPSLSQGSAETDEGVRVYRTVQGIEVLDMSHPIAVKGKVIGRARVAVSRESIRQAVARAGRGLALMSTGILALGLGGLLLMVSLVVGPLGRITADIEAIGNGDLDRRIDTYRRDEVGQIAQAVRLMAAKLKVARERLIEQERMKRELQIARDIQQALLPAALPRLPGLELAARYRAAAEVGGDYYDLIEAGPDRLWLIVADVSGKGVGGSMVMTMLRSIVRLEGGRARSPGRLLKAVDAALQHDIPEGMFVTLFCALLEPKAGRLRYCRAGHNPAYLFRPGEGRLTALKARGQPLGISFGGEGVGGIEEGEAAFGEGDLLVAYTDGIIEASDAEGRQFGEAGLEQAILESGRLSPDQLADEVMARLESYTGGRPQSDDVTLLVARRSHKA